MMQLLWPVFVAEIRAAAEPHGGDIFVVSRRVVERMAETFDLVDILPADVMGAIRGETTRSRRGALGIDITIGADGPRRRARVVLSPGQHIARAEDGPGVRVQPLTRGEFVPENNCNGFYIWGDTEVFGGFVLLESPVEFEGFYVLREVVESWPAIVVGGHLFILTEPLTQTCPEIRLDMVRFRYDSAGKLPADI